MNLSAFWLPAREWPIFRGPPSSPPSRPASVHPWHLRGNPRFTSTARRRLLIDTTYPRLPWPKMGIGHRGTKDLLISAYLFDSYGFKSNHTSDQIDAERRHRRRRIELCIRFALGHKRSYREFFSTSVQTFLPIKVLIQEHVLSTRALGQGRWRKCPRPATQSSILDLSRHDS
jgi:hypothetical protein